MNIGSEVKIKPEKIHYCPECGASFNRPYKLKQHILLHNNIRNFVCGEKGCAKSYSSKSHLDRHIYSVHVKEDINVSYSCPQCKKIFSNRQNLKRHINIKHIKNCQFECEDCGCGFSSKHQLSAHTVYRHGFIKSFSSEIDDKKEIPFRQKKKRNSTRKSYNCDYCFKTFNHWPAFQMHKKMEHYDKKYICNECGKNFKHRDNIVHHIKIHAVGPGEAAPKVYYCPYEGCDKSYSRNNNLKQHIDVKHMKITFDCTICCAKLSSKAKLNYHLQLHSNIRQPPKQPKTNETGQKERKDKGKTKSTADEIADLISGDLKNTTVEIEIVPEINSYIQIVM